jgi:hypothetical protein
VLELCSVIAKAHFSAPHQIATDSLAIDSLAYSPQSGRRNPTPKRRPRCLFGVGNWTQSLGGTGAQPPYRRRLRPSQAYGLSGPARWSAYVLCGHLRRRCCGVGSDLRTLPRGAGCDFEDFYAAWAAQKAVQAWSSHPQVPILGHRGGYFAGGSVAVRVPPAKLALIRRGWWVKWGQTARCIAGSLPL